MTDQKKGSEEMKRNRNREDARLAAIVVLCLFVAVGPGLLLVNRPIFFAGIPIVYAWAIFWYFVFCGIALAARTNLDCSDEKTTDRPE